MPPWRRMKNGNRTERPAWRSVNGVFLLDKPLGLSSNHALQRVRRLFRAAKAGHTGTLDPLASGLLPLCLGEATKYAGWILDAPKSYRATLMLGITSDTGDGEGTLVPGLPFEGDGTEIEAVLPRFMGPGQQIPPMHSALKVQGQTLYDLARRGTVVERAPRDIHIHALTPVSLEGACLTLDVTVSKGTYIRVLAQDIGVALGCGAYLAGLRRTATGPFQLDDAVTLETLESWSETQRDGILKPVATLLEGLPRVTLERHQAQSLQRGQTLAWDGPAPEGACRLYDGEERFYGLVQYDGAAGGRWLALRMMGEAMGERT